MSIIHDTFMAGRAVGSPIMERFCSRIVEGVDGCWLWTLKGKHFTFTVDGTKKCRSVARIAWEQANGRIRSKGKVVVHACGARRCVRPDHLRLVSQSEGSGLARRVGTAHWRSKVTDDDVRAIRAAHDAGDTFGQIGSRYGMSGVNAYYIATRKTWAHVSDVNGSEVRP